MIKGDRLALCSVQCKIGLLLEAFGCPWVRCDVHTLVFVWRVLFLSETVLRQWYVVSSWNFWTVCEFEITAFILIGYMDKNPEITALVRIDRTHFLAMFALIYNLCGWLGSKHMKYLSILGIDSQQIQGRGLPKQPDWTYRVLLFEFLPQLYFVQTTFWVVTVWCPVFSL